MPQNVTTDAEIILTDYITSKKYKEKLRLVKIYDEEKGQELAFLTNAFHLTSLEIANLYKNRWQVELFFKWLKQHLKIRKFWGKTENAVRIQISAAIITYCLVAIVQHDMRLERSTYEVLQILSMSLTDKTPLKELLEKTKIEKIYVNGSTADRLYRKYLEEDTGITAVKLPSSSPANASRSLEDLIREWKIIL